MPDVHDISVYTIIQRKNIDDKSLYINNANVEKILWRAYSIHKWKNYYNLVTPEQDWYTTIYLKQTSIRNIAIYVELTSNRSTYIEIQGKTIHIEH